MAAGVEALTEKEKQTLRLLLVGHDAKSMARHFDLSVHTINERLRDARRKLSVSSSKEAARLLREAEGAALASLPEFLGDAPFGEAAAAQGDQDERRSPASRSSRPLVWAIGGTVMMSFVAALLALSAPVQAPTETPAASAPAPIAESAVTKAAREWLALVEQAKWQESWAATGKSFRAANTVAVWQSAAEKVQVPFGRMLSRTLLADIDAPSPPNGTRTVQFRTDYANKRGVIETLSLVNEDGGWRVAGIYVD